MLAGHQAKDSRWVYERGELSSDEKSYGDSSVSSRGLADNVCWVPASIASLGCVCSDEGPLSDLENTYSMSSGQDTGLERR